MDRDTVRLILLILGICFVSGIYLWDRFKNRDDGGKSARPSYDGDSLDEVYSSRFAEKREPKLENPGGSGQKATKKRSRAYPTEKSVLTPEFYDSGLERPSHIQLSIVARHGGKFAGPEIAKAFTELDLEYGDFGIFHRYTANSSIPIFSVASMVKPGTFPVDDLETFETPGVTLFFQPSTATEPVGVFDEFVYVFHVLAKRLNGEEWDSDRQPLTLETLESLRTALKA